MKIEFILLDAQFLTDLIAGLDCDEVGDAIMGEEHLRIDSGEMVPYAFSGENLWRALESGVPFELVTEAPLLSNEEDEYEAEAEAEPERGEPQVVRFSSRIDWGPPQATPFLTAVDKAGLSAALAPIDISQEMRYT